MNSVDDELFSDAYDIIKVNEFIWEVNGKIVQIKDGVDNALIGANPSAEEGDLDVDDTVQNVINVVHASGLEEIPFSSVGDYKSSLKTYLQRVKEEVQKKHPERVTGFTKAVQEYWKNNVFKNFKDYQFYRSANYEAELQYFIPVNYREDNETPYFVFIVDGLIEEKC